MNPEILKGIIRHVLTIAGGALVASGYLSADNASQLVGAITAIIGVIWSIQSKLPAKS